MNGHVQHVRYIVESEYIHSEHMFFSSLHIVGEIIILDSVRYITRSVILDGTCQIVDMDRYK